MNANSKCCKAFLISVVLLTAFYMALSFVVHHIWLGPDYAATAHLWRTQEEMDALGMWWPVYYLIIACIVTCWFASFKYCGKHCSKEGENAEVCCPVSGKKFCCPVKSGGMCFGIKLGLLMGFMMGCSWLYMPVPASLAIKWFIAGLIQGVGTGIILGMVCGKKNSNPVGCDSGGKGSQDEEQDR